MTDGFQHDGLRGGVWHGSFGPGPQPGPLALVHLGERVGDPVVAAAADGHGWRMSVPLPLDRLADGTTTFLLVEDDGSVGLTGARVIAALPLLAGTPLQADLRTEIDLMRAELELLKREFRREAAETAAARALAAAAAQSAHPAIAPVIEAPAAQVAPPAPTPAPLDSAPPQAPSAEAIPAGSVSVVAPVLNRAVLDSDSQIQFGPDGIGPDVGDPQDGGTRSNPDRRRPPSL